MSACRTGRTLRREAPMPDITRDPAIYIAEIREDLRSGYSEAAVDRIREQHIPALLAMVEAVLELADELDTEDGYTPLPALPRPVSRGDKIRAAICRELPGEAPGA